MDDAWWANAGRDLADALMRFARERGAAEKQRVAELHTEICRARREELSEPPPESNPQPAPPKPPAPAPAAAESAHA